MTEETKDLQTTEAGSVARRVGSNGVARGFDDMDESDIKMPRLAILQPTSQLVTEGKGRIGDFANSVTKEIIGQKETGVEFIPIFMFKTRVRFEQGKGLVLSSRDNLLVTFAAEGFEQYMGKPVSEVPGAEWDGKNPPTFHEVYNYLVSLPSSITSFPICLSLMRTGAAAAKDLNSMARSFNEDFFHRVYRITCGIESNAKGTFAVPAIMPVRRSTDTEYKIASDFFEALHHKRDKIDVNLEEEPLASSETN